jgi:uncharacterized protein (DUF58 family)
MQAMDTRELLKRVRKIEIKTKRLSENLFSGEYHSSFKGRGMAFSEVRPYQVGDDIRAIDWNVTARLNEPYIKVFEEERELTLMLLVDVSGSGAFGSRMQTRREMATEICATLAFSAITNNDKVGLLLFSNEIETFIPPKKGRSHILRIIRALIEWQPVGKGTDVGKALEYLSQVLKKKTIVFLVSDFYDEDYERPLRIAARRHDLTGIRLFDSLEEQLPDMGMLAAVNPENGRISYVNTGSSAFRKAYQMRYFQQVSRFRDAFRKAGASAIEIRLDQSYVKALMGYFKSKGPGR